LKALARIGYGFISLALAVLIWQIAVTFVSSSRFPSISQVVNRLYEFTGDSRFWEQLGATLGLSLGGLALGVFSALLIGVPLGVNRFVDQSSRGTVNFLRSLPAVVILPLLVAGAGASVFTALAVTTIVVALKLVLFVIRGVQDIDPVRTELGQVLQFGRVQALQVILLPAILIFLATGIRLSIQRAYGAVVVSGLVIGTPGLGAMLRLAQINADSAGVFALALVMALVGLGLFYSFASLEQRISPWLSER
jgi:ABC-type nitrate/sulfonate/bicarbonate transport system permease component